MKINGLVISLIVVGIIVFSSGLVHADAGISRAYIQLNDNGSSSWYDTGMTTALPDFEQDFGSFSSGDTFQITGGELNTWQSGADSITKAFVVYRIYSGAAPGFTFEEVNWTADAGFNDAAGIWRTDENGKKWADNFGAVNILSGLTTGSYTLEVYYLANTSFAVDRYYSNGGNNFKATFDYTDSGSAVPEPTTFAMMGVAVLILLGARRRLRK